WENDIDVNGLGPLTRMMPSPKSVPSAIVTLLPSNSVFCWLVYARIAAPLDTEKLCIVSGELNSPLMAANSNSTMFTGCENASVYVPNDVFWAIQSPANCPTAMFDSVPP